MDDEDDFPWDEVELPAGYASQRVAPPQTEPAPAPQRPLALVGGSTWQHHGEYMDVKKGKLYEQDQQNAAVLGGCARLHTSLWAHCAHAHTHLPLHDRPQSNIFAGLHVMINGLPGTEELKHLLLVHGGVFEFFRNERVTHILAEQLAAGKEDAMRGRQAARAPLIVHPSWVVDSVQQGRRLEVADYLLQKASLQRGQQRMPFPPGDQAVNRSMAAAAVARRGAEALKGRPQTTGTDPQFVSNYYNASRLHLIGEWRARNQRLLASLAASTGRPEPSGGEGDRLIFHVDMDCFFASVAMRDHPDAAGMPVAVAHAGAVAHVANSTAEISSCSYAARKAGVHAGMRVCQAMQLCPTLAVFPYNTEAYELASEAMYRALCTFTAKVEATSIDEAFMDVTGLADAHGGVDAMARAVRDAVLAATRGCPASVGVSTNKLLAKMATRLAKPDGQHLLLPTSAALDFIFTLPVGDLPGVGRETAARLAEVLGIGTVAQLAAARLDQLQRVLGPVAGAKLLAAAHGLDDRPVEPQLAMPKSRGAECNWGVRLTDPAGVAAFVTDLAKEVASRLGDMEVKGRRLVVTARQSVDPSREPGKFLGCGECTVRSKTVQLQVSTSDARVIAEQAQAALATMGIPPNYLRGLGIHMQDLVHAPGDGGAAEAAAHYMAQQPITVFVAGGGAQGHSPQGRPPPHAKTMPERGGAAPRGNAVSCPREWTGARMPNKRSEMSDADWDNLEPDFQAVLLGQWAEIEKERRIDREKAAAAEGAPKARLKPPKKKPRVRSRGVGAKKKQTKADKKAAELEKRKAQAAANAVRVHPPPEVASPPAAGQPLLCLPEPVGAVRSALASAVEAACAAPDARQRDDALAAAGAVLQAHCESCVDAHNSQAAYTLLRAAVRLQSACPAWEKACKAACAGVEAAALHRGVAIYLL